MEFTQVGANGRAASLAAAIDAGSASALVARTSADAVLATVPTDPTTAYTVSTNVLTLAGVPLTVTPTANGTIDHVMLTIDGTAHYKLSAGTSGSGADVIVSTLTTDTNVDFTINSGTITIPVAA